MLDRHTEHDAQAHLDGEDDETARRFGWWPTASTPDTVSAASARWDDDWRAEASAGRSSCPCGRALRLLPAHAAGLGVHEVEAHVAAGNHASRRVAEKAGLSPRGSFAGSDGTATVRFGARRPGA